MSTNPSTVDPKRPQPVVAAALYVLIGDIIGLGVAFGVNVTDAQRGAILALVASLTGLAALLLAWRASRKVTPIANPAITDPRTGALVPLVPAGRFNPGAPIR